MNLVTKNAALSGTSLPFIPGNRGHYPIL